MVITAMDITYRLHDDHGFELLEVTVVGEVHLPDVVRALQTVAPGTEFPCARRLWDFRQATVRLTPRELRTSAEYSVAWDRDEARVAFLVDGDLHFGLARVHAAYRESATLSMQVFRDLDEALAYLSS
jgi:hypothetical protein